MSESSPSPFMRLLPVGVTLLIAFALFSWAKNSYNDMVVLDEQVNTAWSQVENQYQRRADLIPNLVNTVKAYASHERKTLEGVIAARSQATSVSIDPRNLDENALRQFQAAQGQLSGALSRLMAVVEQYPALQANENFLELQAQLEGTENRISVERKRFNETAQKFNTAIRSFPTSLMASLAGFNTRTYFASDPGANHAPAVSFGE